MINKDRSILHVDDDPWVTSLVSKMLAPLGYESTPLNDCALTLDHLIKSQYRLVLLDIDMPARNGLDLLEEIKRLDGGVQVIMLTGMASVSTVLRSLRLGAEACFFKPVKDIEPLKLAIDDAFRKIDRWWESLEDLSLRKKQELLT